MGAKLDRLGADLEKARKKRAEWDARVKDLERRYREEENSEIHEMVHAANLTPDQLEQLKNTPEREVFKKSPGRPMERDLE